MHILSVSMDRQRDRRDCNWRQRQSISKTQWLCVMRSPCPFVLCSTFLACHPSVGYQSILLYVSSFLLNPLKTKRRDACLEMMPRSLLFHSISDRDLLRLCYRDKVTFRNDKTRREESCHLPRILAFSHSFSVIVDQSWQGARLRREDERKMPTTWHAWLITARQEEIACHHHVMLMINYSLLLFYSMICLRCQPISCFSFPFWVRRKLHSFNGGERNIISYNMWNVMIGKNVSCHAYLRNVEWKMCLFRLSWQWELIVITELITVSQTHAHSDRFVSFLSFYFLPN